MNKPSSPLLAELISFLDTLPDPHILCDRDYRIVAANPAYREKWQGQERIIGRTCYEVSHRYRVPCDQSGEACPLLLSLQSGQRERVVHLHHTPLGERFENIELSPILDAQGEIAYFVERISSLPTASAEAHACGLVGRSSNFLAMMALVARVAPAETVALLQGESGTGKELVAAAIHRLSRRAEGPFVAVDCSGLTETLFESELFGHERGAFTGAVARKIGLIEAAAGGTLFLDEVGDIPLSIQVKLLRLLETGTFRRVGSSQLQQADIRVISATHQPLADMVVAGTFRQDLFYRLNIFPIFLPPLRERGDDILLIAESLLPQVAAGRQLRLAREARAWLRDYAFPGNVRELRNILERACLLSDGEEIELRHLPVDQPGPFLRSTVDRGQKAALDEAHVLALLRDFTGSRKALARQLGLSERTLYRYLRAKKEAGLLPP